MHRIIIMSQYFLERDDLLRNPVDIQIISSDKYGIQQSLRVTLKILSFVNVEGIKKSQHEPINNGYRVYFDAGIDFVPESFDAAFYNNLLLNDERYKKIKAGVYAMSPAVELKSATIQSFIFYATEVDNGYAQFRDITALGREDGEVETSDAYFENGDVLLNSTIDRCLVTHVSKRNEISQFCVIDDIIYRNFSYLHPENRRTYLMNFNLPAHIYGTPEDLSIEFVSLSHNCGYYYVDRYGGYYFWVSSVNILAAVWPTPNITKSQPPMKNIFDLSKDKRNAGISQLIIDFCKFGRYLDFGKMYILDTSLYFLDKHNQILLFVGNLPPTERASYFHVSNLIGTQKKLAEFLI